MERYFEGSRLFEVAGYPMIVPTQLDEFARGVHIDYDAAAGEYELEQFILE
jgi:hypothetical protein